MYNWKSSGMRGFFFYVLEWKSAEKQSHGELHWFADENDEGTARNV